MTEAEFTTLVKSMRAAQRKYFATRSGDDLEESKRLEREVDAAVKDRETKQRGFHWENHSEANRD